MSAKLKDAKIEKVKTKETEDPNPACCSSPPSTDPPPPKG